MWKRFVGRSLQEVSSEDQQTLIPYISQYTLFEGVKDEELGSLVPALRVKNFESEDIVCHCSDATHDALILLRGVVAMTKKRGAALHVIRLDKTGSVFNFGPLVGLMPEPTGAKALEGVVIIAVDTRMVRQMLDMQPSMGYVLARDLCRLSLLQADHMLEHFLDYIPPSS